jgi:O-antigen chain-terminating methyltransferase
MDTSTDMAGKGFDRLWDDFYARFEDRYRGSEDEMTARFRQRFTARLAAHAARFPGGRVHDLGCGRGEFLDVCKEAGFTTFGADLSGVFVDTCKRKGHTVEVRDLLSYLVSRTDDSAALIGSFHVVEHCPPEYFLRAIREAHRVLAPGGVLVVETPNINSMFVAARQFYLDPTHMRPVHPDFLQFMFEDAGFVDLELVGHAPLPAPACAHLSDALEGEASKEAAKIEHWLYGPQDILCFGTKRSPAS